MKTIRLYGALRKKFGKEFKLDVRTPAEAVRALCIQLPGFRQHLEEFSEPGYVVRVGTEGRGLDELDTPFAQQEVVKIIPVVAGASAFGRIILGIALIAVAVFVPGIGAVAANFLLGVGTSLVVGGIAELLAPAPPKFEANTGPEATPSYMFDGPVNTMGAGYAVPVGYGELLVGSHVVSAELYSVEEPIGSTSSTATRKLGTFASLPSGLYATTVS
jgi:predicted phage tail protein